MTKRSSPPLSAARYKLRRLSQEDFQLEKPLKNLFDKLPREVLTLVFAKCSFKDLAKLCRVCSLWNTIIQKLRVKIEPSIERKITNDVVEDVVSSCPNLRALYLPTLGTNRELRLVSNLEHLSQLILMVGG